MKCCTRTSYEKTSGEIFEAEEHEREGKGKDRIKEKGEGRKRVKARARAHTHVHAHVRTRSREREKEGKSELLASESERASNTLVTERRSDGQTDRQTDAASPPLLSAVGRALPSQVDEFANALLLKASACCLCLTVGDFGVPFPFASTEQAFPRVPLPSCSATSLHLSYSRVCLDATHRATRPPPLLPPPPRLYVSE